MANTDRASVVIAVAGPSGAGKTTLVRQLAAELDNAAQVYFDDYETVSSYPEDLLRWMAAGADLNQWQTPRMADDLRMLRVGRAILLPDGKTTLQPTRYIVVEEPFGRERQELAPLIDFVVGIDVPLEIALARRIRRTFKRELELWDAEKVLKKVDDYLDEYLRLGSTFYGAMNRRALASCDLAVDGKLPVEQLAEQIAAQVRSRFSLD